ncbi:MAG: SMP-30/gluconolactonase/LRE family protein [Planctomycetaceae bacterium]|nr:SMP-30/gluconolactonase/LRE family protein [Planctomycetaceae bacterium]
MKRCLVAWLCGLMSSVSVAQDMPLSQVLIDGEGWRLVADGYQFTEGPAADRDGNVFFVDVPTSRILKIAAADGKVTTFAENTGKASGLFFGPDGKLFACQSATKKVVWYDAGGKETVIAEDVAGNDLAVDRQGNVYVTDMGGRKVWQITPTGEKRVAAEGFQPNGITLTLDESAVVVADWEQPHLWAFRKETDGGLKFGAPYCRPLQVPLSQKLPGSDGMTADDAGRLYVCTHAGLQVFDPTGRLCGAIAKPQEKFLSNVIFGGPKFDTLYVTCSDKVFMRRTKTTGTPHYTWQPPEK